MKKSYLQYGKKIIATLLLVVIVFITLQPKKTHALFGIVHDPLHTTVSAVTAGAAVDQGIVTHVLNGLAWTVAKVAVQSITRSTVNWINSGFQGSPAFVTDLRQNLSRVSDAVAESFLNELDNSVIDATGFSIRSPFQDQVNEKLRNEFYRQARNHGIEPFTLGQYSSDPAAFLNGDISQGGINAFLSASQNDQNNPFGQYLSAQHALFASVNSATEQRKAEIRDGRGFLSFRGNCGTPVSAAVSAGAIKDFSTTGAGSSGGSVDLLGQTNGAIKTPVNTSNIDPCVGKKIITPGSAINAQLEKALGNGVDTLQLADSINEIVGALAGQLVNKVLGVGGLLGASDKSSDGGGSAVDQATAPSAYNEQATTLADGFAQSVVNQKTSLQTYQSNQQKIFDTATAAKNACSASNPAIVPEIQAALDLSSAALAKASASLTSIDSISAKITEAKSQPFADRTTAIIGALSENQDFLNSSSLPTPSEQATAAADALDTGTSTPPSTFSRLKQISATCGRAL
jgi:hypothetical protein